ncbi:Saccharopine dehydrogenase [Seminavis robusta]|uniref:Saccharopine dehydrogenase n=1 Tax=Seminavis robusta TaxID=568900 RepID=A0A9N8DR58_9STRA|nr:Saccharopine dehydrogenase [Seminavis robusta]|eukprot:Sro229_g092950.1 Saccharopine dehydrogenase (434) ;mRNA; f:25246-26921
MAPVTCKLGIVIVSIALVLVEGFAPQRVEGKFKFRTKPIEAASSDSSISFDALQGKRILVVGGSGRVGGSVVTQLVKRGASKVTVGGTNEDRFEQSMSRWIQLFDDLEFVNTVSFESVQREDPASFEKVLQASSYDLVVHTAGPFQGKVTARNGVLEACVANNVAYVDVCDDYCTATAAKTKYQKQAQENGVPCLLSTGCWPGVSSLMAKQLVTKVLEENPKLSPSDLKVDFGFFTAGSGGAGATLLVATFLILAEKALMVVEGRRRPVQAMKEYKTVNFGDVIGDKEIAHLNLLETASVHDVLGVGSVKSLFGTAPGFWNTLLVDFFAGATNAMRCDVTTDKDPTISASLLYGHENLEPCVGECVAAFCCAILSGTVKPGVWFTEEAIQEGDAAAVLGLASVGAHTKEYLGTIDIAAEEMWGTTTSPNLVNA